MLINCPRCGFSQPKDQYCAQCGVDMESYKPKEEPALQKLFSNVGFQIFLLLAAAVFAGQYVIRSDEPQRWVQKITHFQGVSKSTPKSGMQNSNLTEENENSTSVSKQMNQLNNLKNKELEIADATEQPIQTGTVNPNLDPNAVAANPGLKATSKQNAETTQDISSPNFKISFAEVSSETVAKWAADSSATGLYQNMQEYSAGVLSDFRKRNDLNFQTLKTFDKKLSLSQTDTNLSGTMSEDGSQMLGLVTTIEYKSNDGTLLHGSINISRNNRQAHDNFPAEFDLPKGAVFYMIGVLKRNSLVLERRLLTMPPFQIFKSADFMTQKTEFVIIVEPEYR